MTRVYFHSKMLAERQHQGMDVAEHIGLKRLKALLNLTDDQEKTVSKELDDYAKYYQNIEEERDDVATHGKYRILAVLTPEQRQKFYSLFGKPR